MDDKYLIDLHKRNKAKKTECELMNPFEEKLKLATEKGIKYVTFTDKITKGYEELQEDWEKNVLVKLVD